MATEIDKEITALGRMTPTQLREKYIAVFGEATVTKNRTWLIRRIAWRLQVLAEGDLSQRARDRATELARDADLRVVPPREKAKGVTEPAPAAGRTVAREVSTVLDGRLPPPGAS